MQIISNGNCSIIFLNEVDEYSWSFQNENVKLAFNPCKFFPYSNKKRIT